MPPVDLRQGRMLQRSSAPLPLNLAPANQENTADPQSGIQQQSRLDPPPIDDVPPPSKFPGNRTRPVFSSNFSFAADGATPSPPPSAGLPGHPRPRSVRARSPSSKRNSMLQDEDSEWDTTKMLPQFQHTIRRPSLLTPPTTADSRRQSYDRNTHLGYDDGSTEIPQGRRSSVPTHHLRPEQHTERPHSNLRRSSLATTSLTRQELEEEDEKSQVEVVPEVDSGEEELAAADTADLESVEAKTADLNLEESTSVPPSPSLKRESDESDANITSSVNTPIPNPFEMMHDVPYPYILKRLLDFGAYFVGHDETAQVYVEAIQLNEKNSTYKVEVVPRDTESEPFRIVKRYKYCDSDSSDQDTPPPESPVTPIDDDEVEYTSPRLPIHVEYAVFRLPFLGSMLLSGQVFCGDTLKIPLPYPEVWTSVVGWMYTNKVLRLPGLEAQEQAEMVRDNIEFLGGRV